MAPAPVQGLLHRVQDWPYVTAFEYGAAGRPNLVVWIGGLGDNLASTAYVPTLAAKLNAIEGEGGWGLVQANLRSGGSGWGGSNVEEDAEGLAKVVEYFRAGGRQKIVLMGFSTGCQDAIAYSHLQASSSFPKLDAVILQAPVSDREIIEALYSQHIPSPSEVPEDLDTFTPPAYPRLFHNIGGVTYRRWLSLVWKPKGDDIDLAVSEDFFSSDLSDQRLRNVFAPVTSPLLVFLSSNDISYPQHVKEKLPALLERFKSATNDGIFSPVSGILDGAGHDVEQEEPQKEMIEKVVKFVQQL
ncbi:hypothetical protein JCM8547_008194 [Rhodosporidiobolus lusitaniae]